MVLCETVEKQESMPAGVLCLPHPTGRTHTSSPAPLRVPLGLEAADLWDRPVCHLVLLGAQSLPPRFLLHCVMSLGQSLCPCVCNAKSHYAADRQGGKERAGPAAYCFKGVFKLGKWLGS